ncbi:MAG: alpha/beta fold hydrolase [Lachnospiraceae bacterium]|nr:alpha/beta fold hydrolase [Lachnospiraceae bacterium]
MKDKKVKHPKNKKKIALITVISILAVFFLVLMPVLTVLIYHDNFGERFETAEWMAYSVDDFEGLTVSECTFPSNNGQLLAGYQYSKENWEKKGVVVIAHGLGGGGQNTYMDIADYFTSNGYLVFAYDATGNDKSEGDSVKGLPQGIIDLDYALRYVKETEEYQNLPIVLFGHSWGGYSVGNVLNCHPDVKAAVLVAGFDSSMDLIEQQGELLIGSGIQLFVPYASLYERLKFGKYASYSAIDGFAASNAGIMVICSRDDTTVLPENGYDKFYEVYGNDPRFYFVEYEDRGHNYIYNSQASQRYREQLNEDYTDYVEANGGEYNAQIKTEFMEKYLDKSKCYELDYGLMQQILGFYDSYCEPAGGR